MMVKQLEKEHLRSFILRPCNKKYEAQVKDIHLYNSHPNAYACIDEDGYVVMCAGIVEYWKGRGEAWAVLDQEIAPKKILALTKIVKRYLKMSPFRRVEATTEYGNWKAKRWVRNIGFKLDAVELKCFLPDGSSADLYSYVKELQ